MTAPLRLQFLEHVAQAYGFALNHRPVAELR